MSDYKAFKEASVSGLTGSTISHVNMISFVALVCLPARFLRALTRNSVGLNRPVLYPPNPRLPSPRHAFLGFLDSSFTPPAAVDDAVRQQALTPLVPLTRADWPHITAYTSS
jgi:hypothetical protein